MEGPTFWNYYGFADRVPLVDARPAPARASKAKQANTAPKRTALVDISDMANRQSRALKSRKSSSVKGVTAVCTKSSTRRSSNKTKHVVPAVEQQREVLVPSTPSLMEDTQDVMAVEPVDPLLCSEHAEDIHAHLKRSEASTYQPLADYVKYQSDVHAGMLSILMDWLVDVGEEFELKNETIHLAKNYTDRFLAQRQVSRTKLQLVGAVAIMIASKFEEIYPPTLDEFVYVTDNAYTKEEMIEVEATMLEVLAWNLVSPTPIVFVDRYVRHLDDECDAAAPDRQCATSSLTSSLSSSSSSSSSSSCVPGSMTTSTPSGDAFPIQHLAYYLCELTLVEHSFLTYLPSEIATAALVLALYASGRTFPWSSSLQNCCGMQPAHFNGVIAALWKLWKTGPGKGLLGAVKTKYRERRWSRVATSIPVPPRPPAF